MSDANAYVAEIRAERDRLREVVARVEGLATWMEADQDELWSSDDMYDRGRAAARQTDVASLRRALSASSPSAEQPYTETDVPAPTGRHEGAQRRHAACVARWPEATSGTYDPRCCRFPKSCSATIPAEDPPEVSQT